MVYTYIFMWSKCKGLCNIFLEFCFTYYTVIYILFFFFCLSINCIFVILHSIMILLNFIEFHEEQLISAKFQHSEHYAFEVQALDTPLFHLRFL